MIFIGDCFEFEFKTKTKNSIRCALGKQFYMLLFSDNSVIHKGTTHHVCFVVPIHYPSFIKSISKNSSISNSIDLFEFKNMKDKEKLIIYIQNLSNHDFEIMKDLESINKK